MRGSNARLHEGKRWVYNVDLEDFFPSITWPRVYGMFLAKPFEASEDVARLLANLATHDGALPQGGPASPILSNLVTFRLDHRLYRWARSRGHTYSRYADDLTFSTDRRDFSLEDQEAITRIVEEEGFTLNARKTRLQAYYERQEVTGLVVNEKANVPREYVRNLRALLRNVERYGWRSQVGRRTLGKTGDGALPDSEDEESVGGLIDRYRGRELSLAEYREVDDKQSSERLLVHPEALLFGVETWEDLEALLLGRVAFVAQVRGEDDPVVSRLRETLEEIREKERRPPMPSKEILMLEPAAKVKARMTAKKRLVSDDPALTTDKGSFDALERKIDDAGPEGLFDVLNVELGGAVESVGLVNRLKLALEEEGLLRDAQLDAVKRDARKLAYALLLTVPERTGRCFSIFAEREGFNGLLHPSPPASTNAH